MCVVQENAGGVESGESRFEYIQWISCKIRKFWKSICQKKINY